MRRPTTAAADVTRFMEVMAAPFPTPSLELTNRLDDFRLAAALPPLTQEELRELAMLPRPWDPASCPHELRRMIYLWIDDVVAWINEEHTWRVDRAIPICWAQHPHIVHELATVTCLRWEAAHAVTPTALQEWQQVTLPLFLDRIPQRIGATGCPPGRHQPHPGSNRNRAYRDEEKLAQRRRLRHNDTEHDGSRDHCP